MISLKGLTHKPHQSAGCEKVSRLEGKTGRKKDASDDHKCLFQGGRVKNMSNI